MDEDLKILLLLNSLEGQGRKLWNAVERKEISTDHILECEIKMLVSVGATELAITEIKRKTEEKWAEKEIEKCDKLGVKIISINDSDYPTLLNDLKSPPLVLYWQGEASKFPSLNISVVGTRGASNYGKKMAYKIGQYCASCQVGLISGGASGIDGYSHSGTCDSGGQTFAVFGTGVDVYYPQSNRKLFDGIKEKGALISEYPLGITGQQWHFPRRNRIVASLSERLIVVEAPLKSGAMITAGLAVELGREIWVVPGRIDEASAVGSNRLIYEGAYPLVDLPEFFKSRLKRSMGCAEKPDSEELQKRYSLSQDEEKVIRILSQRSEQTVDNIALEVKMGAADILKIIAILSAKGIVCSSGSGRFSVKV